jgi:hypothetical protein
MASAQQQGFHETARTPTTAGIPETVETPETEMSAGAETPPTTESPEKVAKPIKQQFRQICTDKLLNRPKVAQFRSVWAGLWIRKCNNVTGTINITRRDMIYLLRILEMFRAFL